MFQVTDIPCVTWHEDITWERRRQRFLKEKRLEKTLNAAKTTNIVFHLLLETMVVFLCILCRLQAFARSLDSSFISYKARRETNERVTLVENHRRKLLRETQSSCSWHGLLTHFSPWNTYFCLKEFDTTREDISRMKDKKKTSTEEEEWVKPAKSGKRPLNLYTHHWLHESSRGCTDKRSRSRETSKRQNASSEQERQTDY